MSNKVKFFPTSGVAIQLALTSGHTTVVEPNGTELDERFHAEAVARGCVPESAVQNLVQRAQVSTFNRQEHIVKVLKDMARGDDPNAFTSNGMPNKLTLDKLLGFTSDRNEIEEAWEIAKQQLDEEEEGEGEGAGAGEGAGEGAGAGKQPAGGEGAAVPSMTLAAAKVAKKADLQAYLTAANVKYETDANNDALRKLVIDHIKATAK